MATLNVRGHAHVSPVLHVMTTVRRAHLRLLGNGQALEIWSAAAQTECVHRGQA